MTYESIIERIKKLIDEHDEDTCETCELFKAQEKVDKEIDEMNKKRIADGLEPLDCEPTFRLEDHCPICLGPLYSYHRACSAKCVDEFNIIREGQRNDKSKRF